MLLFERKSGTLWKGGGGGGGAKIQKKVHLVITLLNNDRKADGSS